MLHCQGLIDIRFNSPYRRPMLCSVLNFSKGWFSDKILRELFNLNKSLNWNGNAKFVWLLCGSVENWDTEVRGCGSNRFEFEREYWWHRLSARVDFVANMKLFFGKDIFCDSSQFLCDTRHNYFWDFDNNFYVIVLRGIYFVIRILTEKDSGSFMLNYSAFS